MTGSLNFGFTANLTALGCLTGRIVPIVTKRCAFGLAASLAGLGCLTGRIAPIVTGRYAFGLATYGTGLGIKAGCIVPIVSERVTIGLAANLTGLGCLAGCIIPIVTGRGLFDIEAYGTVFILSAGEGGVVVLSRTFNKTGQQIGKGCFGITVKFIGRCARSMEIVML